MELTKVYDREFYGDEYQQMRIQFCKVYFGLGISVAYKPRSVIDIGCGVAGTPVA